MVVVFTSLSSKKRGSLIVYYVSVVYRMHYNNLVGVFELKMKSENWIWKVEGGEEKGGGVRLSELLDRFPDIIGYSPPVSLTMPNLVLRVRGQILSPWLGGYSRLWHRVVRQPMLPGEPIRQHYAIVDPPVRARNIFCRNRILMVPRACNTRFLKIVFDSSEICDF